jgi:hypothetical protein
LFLATGTASLPESTKVDTPRVNADVARHSGVMEK